MNMKLKKLLTGSLLGLLPLAASAQVKLGAPTGLPLDLGLPAEPGVGLDHYFDGSAPLNAAPDQRVQADLLGPEAAKSLTEFVEKKMHQDVRAVVGIDPESPRREMQLSVLVPGAEANYAIEAPKGNYPFGSRGWAWTLAAKLHAFNQAYKEGRIGQFLAFGNSGIRTADGSKVYEAIRQGDPADKDPR
jgi:hypothetical protein